MEIHHMKNIGIAKVVFAAKGNPSKRDPTEI
jgi:hypothetical protein